MLLGAVLGYLTWQLSATFTGTTKEAWDVPGYYIEAMALSGVTCGLLSPKAWLPSSVAILFGKFFATNFGLGMFGPVGTVSLLIGTVPALAAAFLGACAVRVFRRGVGSNT